MTFQQYGGTLLDTVKPLNYQKSRLSIKINTSNIDTDNYSFQEVNQIDELFFLDKETSMIINPDLDYTGFIIWGILDFNTPDNIPKYYDNFCISTYRNPCEAFRCGTVVLRCTDVTIIDSIYTRAYGKTVYDRFNTAGININNSFKYKIDGKYVIQNNELTLPVHSRVFESLFYTGDRENTGINTESFTTKSFIDEFRQYFRSRGYEILMTGLTRDKTRGDEKHSWKIKSGTINAYYYKSFCYGDTDNEKFDLFHRSAENDAFFLNNVLDKIKTLYKNTYSNSIFKIIEDLNTRTHDEGQFVNSSTNNQIVWQTMKNLRGLILANTKIKEMMKGIYSAIFGQIRTEGMHLSSGSEIEQMLDILMKTSGIKTKEIADMLEKYEYTGSSGRITKIGESECIYNDINQVNYSQRYLINRSKEKNNENGSNRIGLDPYQDLIIRKKFNDCVKKINGLEPYLFYLIDTSTYNISCPYGKIESPKDDHIYFIDFTNGTQRDIMFDGLSKILNFDVSFHDFPRDDISAKFYISNMYMSGIINIYKTFEIIDNFLLFKINNITITISNSYFKYNNAKTKKILYVNVDMNELNLNNFLAIKKYLTETYDDSYVFDDIVENNSIISYLVYHKENLRQNFKSVHNNYASLDDSIKNTFKLQKYIFNILFITSLNVLNDKTDELCENFLRSLSRYTEIDFLSEQVFNSIDQSTNIRQFSIHFSPYWPVFFHSKIVNVDGKVILDTSVFRSNILSPSSIPFMPHTDKVYYASQYFLRYYDKNPDNYSLIMSKLNFNKQLSIYEIALLIHIFYDELIKKNFYIPYNEFPKKDEIFSFLNLLKYNNNKDNISRYFQTNKNIFNDQSKYISTNIIYPYLNQPDPDKTNEMFNPLFELYRNANLINKLYILNLLGLSVNVSVTNDINPDTVLKKYYQLQDTSTYIIPYVITFDELGINIEEIRLKINSAVPTPTLINRVVRYDLPQRQATTGIATTGIATTGIATTGIATTAATAIPATPIAATATTTSRNPKRITFNKTETFNLVKNNIFTLNRNNTNKTASASNECEPGKFAVRNPNNDPSTFTCYDKTDGNLNTANFICKSYGETGNCTPETTNCNMITIRNGNKLCIPVGMRQPQFYGDLQWAGDASIKWEKKYLKYKTKYQQLKYKMQYIENLNKI
jgi:hypothetical protein